jgi:predicted DNA-binding transcriptional regulator AlpA
MGALVIELEDMPPMSEHYHLDRHADLIVPTLAEDDPDDLLTPETVAQHLQVSETTLPGWRNKRIGPPYVRLSARLVRYPRGGLLQWLRSRNTKTDKSPGPPPDVHAARRNQAKLARETGAPRPGLKKPVAPKGAAR